MRKQVLAELWLLMMCVIWGTTFPLVKTALRDVSPFLFLAIRFWLASIFFIPIIQMRHSRINFRLIKKGAVLGLFMFLGISFQTMGLLYTTASKSAFITGLSVVFVPLLVVGIEKKLPSKTAIMGVILAVVGIYFLTEPRGAGFGRGDLLTLFCAFSFSFQIIFIEMLVDEDEALIMAFLMVFFTALLATVPVLFSTKNAIRLTVPLILNLIVVSGLSTTLALWVQSHWQPKTSATAAAVVYTTEPIFASCFSFILLGERMSETAIIGASIILCGMWATMLKT